MCLLSVKTTSLKREREVAKIAEKVKIISFHGHAKITTTYRATIYENKLKTSREDLPQLKT